MGLWGDSNPADSKAEVGTLAEVQVANPEEFPNLVHQENSQLFLTASLILTIIKGVKIQF